MIYGTHFWKTELHLLRKRRQVRKTDKSKFEVPTGTLKLYLLKKGTAWLILTRPKDLFGKMLLSITKQKLRK